MSEARKCDVCGNYGEPPFTDWWSLEGGSRLLLRHVLREKTEACSLECLHRFTESLAIDEALDEAMKP
jgi:hypothetical protein